MRAGRGKIAAALAIAGIALFASAAQADTTDIIVPQHNPPGETDGFQAGPCTSDTANARCAPDTPAQFFKTAGGHPPVAFVQFIVQHIPVSPGVNEPLKEPLEGRIPRTLRVDLPPGLSINPDATSERCTLAEFEHAVASGPAPLCRPGTSVGEAVIDVVNEEQGFLGFPAGQLIFKEFRGLDDVEVFNLQPRPGQPALFGFVLGSYRAFLEPEISWESDFHESFTIRGLPNFKTVTLAGLLAPVAIHTSRLLVHGTAGDGTLVTNPTTCFNPDEPAFRHLYSSWIRLDSYEQPDALFPADSTAVESPLPPGAHPEGCASIPFNPSLQIEPGTSEVDSPAAPNVTIRLPAEVPTRGGGPIAESQLRRAEVTLPEGMGLNPAAAAGLAACSDAQFHKGERIPDNGCPAASVIGTAQVRTPVLTQSLNGTVYLGEPRSTDPTSGEEFRIFVEAKSEELGVVVRLIGKVKANAESGRLTAVFDDQEQSPLVGALPPGLPQVPLESVAISFDQALGALTSPPTCAPAAATGRLEPWARPNTQVAVSAPVRLTAYPGGGACPESMAERPFAPAVKAAPDSARAATYSPFRLRIDRAEGQQELKRVDLRLPAGLIGRLAGIPYCPEAAIAAAARKSGAAERGAPSCPSASLVGTTKTAAGSGGEPLSLPGKVYLAGPYTGAPLSLVAITPAVAGPFDLGTVVLRVALFLDPQSAQIHAVSDPIPDVFGGVKLDLRSIDLALDRPRFTLNPTSCAAQATAGAIAGGGADPGDLAHLSTSPVSTPFQPLGCSLLPFAPKLTTTLAGGTRRRAYPRLAATLTAPEGDANLSQVKLTLPRSFLVAQEHIGSLCSRPKLAEHACPDASVYGQAEAHSPLLSEPLKGPVYLVPNGHPLPDLVADLRGQVELQVHGSISAPHGGIQVTFDSLPDVPVSEFSLQMEGGKKGLIVNSTNVCRKKPLAQLQIAAQNGKQLTNNRYKLAVAGCRKKPRKHKKHRHKRHGKPRGKK